MQTNTTEPMDASKQFCPNPTCSARGKIDEGNIRIHSYEPQRYRCRTCNKTFSARRGTMMEGLRSAGELVVIVVTLLAYGCPVQAIVHAYGLDERTVANWQRRAGEHCQQVHQAIVQQGQVQSHHVQADEIRAKGRQLVMWMALAIDASSRLWLAGVVSLQRDRALADGLMQHVRLCLQAVRALLVCTDGWAAYVRRVGVYEIPVGHGRGREQKPLGQELTRRGNSKVDCSMLLKWKTREDMYLAVLRVLCAW